MNAAKKILILLMVLVFLGGLAYALYPTVNGVILTTSAEYVAEVFLNKTEIVQALTPTMTDSDIPVEPEVPHKDLLEAMEAYNKEIYQEAQAGLCDAWAYQEPSFDLAEYGIEDGVIGVISIPKLDIEMPSIWELPMTTWLRVPPICPKPVFPLAVKTPTASSPVTAAGTGLTTSAT